MMNAILPYYGCKREQAKGLNELFGEHSAWWDLTCGSLAPLFGKQESRVEVVNDISYSATNLALVVQDDNLSCSLFEKLQRTAFSDDIFERARVYLKAFSEKVNGGPNLEHAYHYMTFSWMARNGFAGTKNELDLGLCKRFTSNGGDPAVRFRNAVDSIPSWWHRLRGVTILRECCIKLAKKIEDKVGTIIYVDPPYIEKTCEYSHDFGREEHVQLAEALSRFKKTKVFVSYYAHELVNELYVDRGWHLIDRTTTKKVSAVGINKANEIILTNLL